MSGDEMAIDPLDIPIKQEYDSYDSSSEELDIPQGSNGPNTDSHDPHLPLMEDFLGPANFMYELRQLKQSASPSWSFSHIYKTLFIKIDSILILQFCFDKSNLTDTDLYVRAMIIYCSADHVLSPVNRCVVHLMEDDPLLTAHKEKDICKCSEFNLAGHVLRSGCAEAVYCYDPNSERHSVLCPIKDSEVLSYSFTCKTSCPKGMNRRKVKMVFTLENKNGYIYGKSSLHLKICSSPRRDRLLLENNESNKWLHPSSPPRPVYEELEDENSGDADSNEPPQQLSGEVIMELRSEVKSIRQALAIVEKRCALIETLIEQYDT